MRVGTVCYAVRQGLGYLAKSFFDNGIITDPVIYKHPAAQRKTLPEWYPDGTPIVNSRRFTNGIVEVIDRVDVMIFFETPFDWSVLRKCREMGVKTVLVPMHEWTPVKWPEKPDALFCPSLLDADYFRHEFDFCPYIPIPVETKYWRQRITANRFLHNAGNIGHREHKGTRQLLEAAHLVNSPDFTLTVRGQDVQLLGSIAEEVGLDARVTIEWGERPYDELWEGYDVYVAPEKFNGLSLPIQEAYAAGMMVMTTDRYPANTWLPKEPLIPVESTRPARIGGGYRELDECIVSPQAIADRIDKWIGKDITHISSDAREWGEQNSWDVLEPAIRRALEIVVSE